MQGQQSTRQPKKVNLKGEIARQEGKVQVEMSNTEQEKREVLA